MNEDELRQRLSDPHWRIFSGELYKIMIKSPTGGETIIPFIPNAVQRHFIEDLWYRNIVLKARQRGITTLICIMWLDHALFVSNQRCAVIAQDLGTASEIFRDKVKLAYDNLPEALRTEFSAKTDKAGELLFSNNSSVVVSTSRRGGTTHRLLVSEFGKICARWPIKAKEIQSGAFPSVPLDGVAVVESTAEGADGPFYKMTQRAQGLDRGSLSERDWKFSFYPWWDADEYQLTTPVPVSDKEHAYFDQLELEIGVKISLPRRQWYIATRDNDFAGDEQTMWQEYPSTPIEAFSASNDGVWFSKQLLAAKKAGRIGKFPFMPGVPVNSFWDIGGGDGTGVWLHQRIGMDHRFFKYIEGWDEGYEHFTSQMQSMGHSWGTHFLPHDADHARQRKNKMLKPIDELRELWPGVRWKIVPRVDDIVHGIKLTRSAMAQAYFDESGCKEGLDHLHSYRKEWDEHRGCWRETPRHDEHSEAADALRQWGQEFGSLARIGGQMQNTATIPLSKPSR